MRGRAEGFFARLWEDRSFLGKVILLYVLFIYMTLPVMPFVARGLRKVTGPFFGIVVSLGVLFLVLLIFRKTRPYLVTARAKFWAFFLLFTAVSIVLLLDIPAERIHFLEYGLLGFLLVRYFSFSYPIPQRYILAFVAGAFFGTVDEFLQLILQVQTLLPFLPRRYFEIKDIVQNVFGIYLGIIFYHYIIWEGQKKYAEAQKYEK